MMDISAEISRQLAAAIKVLEARTLRPPLGQSIPTTLEAAPLVALPQEKPKGRKSKKSGKKKDTPNFHISEWPLLPGTQPLELPPPRVQQESLPETEWTSVLGRKATKNTSQAKTRMTPGAAQGKKKKKRGVTKTAERKVPKTPPTAAVTVTLIEGSKSSYGEVMVAARQRINLPELGIESVHQRKTITGALLMEISGDDREAKADNLAHRLQEKLGEFGIRVLRPVKMAEIRVRDLDESISVEEVAAAVAKAGGCAVETVKVGDIHQARNRLGSVWVRCPADAARKLEVAKHVCIGWVSARVEVLRQRALRCYRCLELGHVKNQCSNPTDRSVCCFKCSDSTHRVRDCTSQTPRCPVCADLGCTADHRLGSKKCSPPKRKKTGERAKQVAQNPAPAVTEATANAPTAPPSQRVEDHHIDT